MQIEKLGFRRFKSLYNVEVPLSSFSVLTGPNGSGKSNFAAAVDFLGETYQFGLEYALGRAGGIDSIAYRRLRRTTVPVSFTVKVRLDRQDTLTGMISRELRALLREDYSVWVEHCFGIKPSKSFGDSTFSVANEKFSVTAGRGDQIRHVLTVESTTKKEGREVKIDIDTSADLETLQHAIFTGLNRGNELRNYFDEFVPPTELILSTPSPTPVLRDFRTLLSRLKVYRLNAAACRRPGVLTPNATLERDGGNLPGVVARLGKVRRRRSEAFRSSEGHGHYGDWREILASMAEIFPGLSNISTQNNLSGSLELLIAEDEVSRPWSANEVSDGTIQYLALLAVMFDRRSPALVVEEPENALHSWLLRIFLDRCRSTSDRQVLITTHSPVALRAVRPEEVLLVWKRDGKTTIAPLVDVDPDAARLYGEEGVDVFEQYDSGFLPETLPSWGRA